jgi:hypothetical protein
MAEPWASPATTPNSPSRTLEQLNADGGLVPEHLARRLSAQRIFGIGHAVTEAREC